MTDLHQRLIDGLANVPVLHTPPGSGASQSLWDDEIERVARALLTVIAAHEAEVAGRMLDRIDALHVEHDCDRDGKDIRWECFIVHGGTCANVGRCRGCGLAQNVPCPTRRLTAEIRGELSHG